MDAERRQSVEQAPESLERVRRFDPASLPRFEEPGSVRHFKDAVEPATRLVDRYRQLHVEGSVRNVNDRAAPLQDELERRRNLTAIPARP